MKTLPILTILALVLATAPTVSADDRVCLEPLPDQVEPCVRTDPQICSAIAGCDPDDPTALLQWLRDQLGPCTCDPIE